MLNDYQKGIAGQSSKILAGIEGIISTARKNQRIVLSELCTKL
jgi:hypothetical protein